MHNTFIQWCHHTHNVVIGCVHAGPECLRCYAEEEANRHEDAWGNVWGPARNTSRKILSDAYWHEPLNWEKKAALAGVRERVFCGSMCDVAEDHPTTHQERTKLFPLVEATPHMDWLLLTKRPENFLPYFREAWGEQAWPGNVWAGTSTGLQESLEKRYPEIIRVPTPVTFLSLEPLIGRVNLRPVFEQFGPVKWVIVGGESDRSHKRPARPLQLSWIEEIIQTCQDFGVPVFVKQLGSCYARQHKLRSHKAGDPNEWPEAFRIQHYPEVPPELLPVPRGQLTLF